MNHSEKMPVLFVGHGSPMNAIEENEFSRTWREISKELPLPREILSISAHWQPPTPAVTGSLRPQTIHDFYGFPRELEDVQYPAQGSQDLVTAITEINPSILVDQRWGLDHGTWSVLKVMYPGAEIPVVQLGLGRSLDADGHFKLAQQLAPLREQGVLIMGSGNLVHNLRLVEYREDGFDWAERYDQKVKDWIENRTMDPLIHYAQNGQDAELAINSAEHYLPLLYALGASNPADEIRFYCDKVVMGSVSMCCVRFG